MDDPNNLIIIGSLVVTGAGLLLYSLKRRKQRSIALDKPKSMQFNYKLNSRSSKWAWEKDEQSKRFWWHGFQGARKGGGVGSPTRSPGYSTSPKKKSKSAKKKAVKVQPPRNDNGYEVKRKEIKEKSKSDMIRRSLEIPINMKYETNMLRHGREDSFFSKMKSKFERRDSEVQNLEPKKERRHINIWINKHDSTEPITKGEVHELLVNVGSPQKNSLVSSIATNIERVASKYEDTRITVTLFSDNFEISPPKETLILPPQGESALLTFRIKALSEGSHDIDVCFYFKKELLQLLSVSLKVVGKSHQRSVDDNKAIMVKTLVTSEYGLDSVFDILEEY